MRTHGSYGSRQQPSARQVSGAEAAVQDIPESTPVGQVIHHYARQARFRVSDDAIERRAKHLQSQNSYDEWSALSDRDRELWRHVARVQIED